MTNRGWRRLWPSHFWLQTVMVGAENWNWIIWSSDKARKLACGAADYTRQSTAATGGVRFGAEHLKSLEAEEAKRVAAACIQPNSSTSSAAS